MSKQTAVEYLLEELNDNGFSHLYLAEDIIEQAKEMEKEQIIDAFGVGCHVESTRLIHYDDMAEQYYNETFKKL